MLEGARKASLLKLGIEILHAGAVEENVAHAVFHDRAGKAAVELFFERSHLEHIA